MGMSVLRDTHALLWALTEPDRLSLASRRRIADPGTDLLASAASAWEVAAKHRLGKLPEADALVGAFADYVRELGAAKLPIRSAHALLAGRLDLDHRDPSTACARRRPSSRSCRRSPRTGPWEGSPCP